MEGLPGVRDVTVSVHDTSYTNVEKPYNTPATLWTVTFHDPVGDIPNLEVSKGAPTSY